MRIQARRSTPAALGLTLTLLVAGCGTSVDDSGGGPATDQQTARNGDVFNTADVTFAQSMIQHHAQAIQMVILTQERSLDSRVEELANSVRDAQVPEIETMSDWLTVWGEEVPETSLSHSNAGHDIDDSSGTEGMDDMPGMTSKEDMQSLEDASDAEFQSLWLDLMIEHHQGAVEVAQTEQDHGHFEPALSLADRIVATQTREIATMEDLRE